MKLNIRLRVVPGAGVGMIVTTQAMVLMMHFDEYRGLATGCQYAGWSSSGLVFPKILTSLKQQYGFRGAVLIVGAIVTHTTALALLLKEPPWLEKARSQGNVKDHLDAMLPNDETSQVPWKYSQCEKLCPSFRALLRAPMLYVIISSCVTAHYTYIVFVRSILDYAMDKAVGVSESNDVIVYTSISLLAGPLLIPVLSDMKFLTRSMLQMMTFFLLGILLLAYPETLSYGSYVLVSVCIAALLGSALSMKTTLMADYLGVAQISNCQGVVGVVFLPVLLCNPSVVGEYNLFLFS